MREFYRHITISDQRMGYGPFPDGEKLCLSNK
jgi:hypothetical protein